MSDPSPGLAQVLADPEGPARRHAAQGGRVVGILGPGAPRELVAASGAWPLRLLAAPATATPLADAWIEPVQEAAIRSVFERLLSGAYGFLDRLIVPRCSEQALQFYYLAEHVRAETPGIELPPLHLFNLLQTPTDRSTRFVRAELDRLRDALDGAGNDALRAEIAARNAARAAFRRASEARRGARGTTGIDMLALAMAGEVLPTADFARLAGAANPTGQGGARILLAGSGQDSLRLTRLIEKQGARVVAEDHDRGEPLFAVDMPVTPDPLDGLALHCQFHAPTVRLPVETLEARFAALVAAVRPDGVVFALDANDDTLGWDIPRRLAHLRPLGIPALVLTGIDPRAASPDPEGRLGPFLDTLREEAR